MENLRRVCSWCGLVMDEGSPGAKITHGMCAACQGKMEIETQNYWLARKVPNPEEEKYVVRFDSVA